MAANESQQPNLNDKSPSSPGQQAETRAVSMPARVDTATPSVSTAEGYADDNLVVIPLNGKIPDWTAWQKKTVEQGRAEIRKRARNGTLRNIGIVAGVNSGNLFQVEIDGLDLYHKIVAEIPNLKDTWTVLSGSGNGAHIYGRADVLPSTTIANFKGEHLEIRFKSDGQQCVAPPSIHPESKRPYTTYVDAPIRHFDQTVVNTLIALIEAHRPARPVELTQREVVIAPSAPGQHRAYALAAMDGMVTEVARLTNVKDDPQNDTMHTNVVKLAAFAQRGDLSRSEVFSALESAMRSNGYIGGFGYHAFSASFESGWNYGTSSTQYVPKCYQEGFAAQKPKTKKPIRKQHPIILNNQYQNNGEFVSETLTPDVIEGRRTLLIAAPTGMGKTTAIADYLKAKPTGKQRTGIAQFRLLTQQAAHKFDFPHYEDADGANQRALGQLDDLVTSVQSLAKFDRKGGTVIIDEIEGVLRFLSDSSTFRGGEALAALAALELSVTTADQLIGMDANLSPVVIEWVEALRGKATVKRFSSPKTRGSVTILNDDKAGIYQIEKLLKHRRGPVYVACSGENKASQIAEFYGEYKVLKVTRDTSNTEAVRQASISAAARSEYDLIIYDSSWGAGVDIAEPVYAQVCIFDRMPLAPEDAIQLFGRVRHATRRYAVVPADSEGYPTESADQLVADKIKRECWTAAKVGMEPHITGNHLKLAQLWGKFEARRRAESAKWRRFFVQRLQANGYTVAENNAAAPALFAETWKTWRKERKNRHWTTVLDLQGEALPTVDLDRMRMNGVEIVERLKLRNVRYEIESALAVDQVVEQDRDLMARDNRKKLYRLADLVGDDIDVLDADRAQAQEGRPIHKRRYSALDRRTVARLFELAGHTGRPEEQLMAFAEHFRQVRPAAEVETHYEALMDDRATRLFEALGHRGNNSQTVTGRCRWLLDYFGLKLKSTQRREKGAPKDAPRPMFYEIDAEVLAYRLARARRAAQARLMSKNVQDQESYTFLDTNSEVVQYPNGTAHLGNTRTEPPKGWGGASKYNPFSKAGEVVEVYL